MGFIFIYLLYWKIWVLNLVFNFRFISEFLIFIVLEKEKKNFLYFFSQYQISIDILCVGIDDVKYLLFVFKIFVLLDVLQKEDRYISVKIECDILFCSEFIFCSQEVLGNVVRLLNLFWCLLIIRSSFIKERFFISFIDSIEIC